MQLTTGTLVAGRYCVLGRLGSGAVAVVYLVRHEPLGTLHALKVLQLPTWSIQRRLMLEGRIQGSLNHPNVVGVTDAVEIDGSPGLVMELVQGPTLDRLLQHGRLPLPVVRALGVGVLAGVAAAHREGLVHRDLKPANVLVDAAGDALVPRVTDFGLAKLLGSEGQGAAATRSGASLGTPAYMAPEQIRDPRDVDQRADVFALGAVLYELVAGRRAFPGDALEVFRRIDEGRYEPMAVVAPDAPGELVDAIDAALRPDPTERPQHVAELLDRWTGGRGADAVLAETAWAPELVSLTRQLGRVGEATAIVSPSASRTWDPGTSVIHPVNSPTPSASRPARPRSAPLLWALPIAAMAAAAGLLALGLVLAGTAGALYNLRDPASRDDPQVSRRSAVYTADGVAPIDASDEAVRADREAWEALLRGEPAEAEAAARRAVLSSDAVGPRLVLVAALLELGDPRARSELRSAAERAGRGADGDLARLAHQAMVEGPDLAAIEDHLKRHPQDLLARLMFPAIENLELDFRVDCGEQAVALAGEWPGPRVRLARLLLAAGRWSGVDEALARVPAEHLGARSLRAELRLRLRDEVDARDQADAVLSIDVSHAHAWYVRAGAAATWPADLAALGSDPRRIPERASVAFARGATEGLFGRGRPSEAREWLDRGFEAARLGADVEGLVALTRLEVAMACSLGGEDHLEQALARVERAGRIGLPGSARDRIGLQEVFLEGMLALERGDPAGIQRALLELQALEGGARLADSLRAASFARRGDASRVAAFVEDDCVGRSFRARWLADAGDARAEESFAAVVGPDSPCGWFGTDRYARAHAHAELAARMLDAGETAEAERQFQAFEALLPASEVGLPAYLVAMGVRERLDIAPQGL